MKKIIIFIFLIISFTLNAQSRFGIKAGYNLSYMTVNIPCEERIFGVDIDLCQFKQLNVQPLSGFHIGTTMDINLSKRFFIQSSLLFSRKGTIIKQSDISYITNWSAFSIMDTLITTKTIRTNNLEFPISIGYRLKKGKLTISFLTGAYIGIILGGNIKTNIDFLRSDTKRSTNDKLKVGDSQNDILRLLDYGLSFGTSFEVNRVSIAGQFNLGLMNTMSKGNGLDLRSSTPPEKMNNIGYNRSINISMTYFFDSKK